MRCLVRKGEFAFTNTKQIKMRREVQRSIIMCDRRSGQSAASAHANVTANSKEDCAKPKA